MPLQLHKYWHDLLIPVLRHDRPPTVPQAIVLLGQQVLLVQRDNPRFWELPGGGMAPGETAEETVVREVQEETGVRVEIVELLGWYERTGWNRPRHCNSGMTRRTNLAMRIRRPLVGACTACPTSCQTLRMGEGAVRHAGLLTLAA